MRVAYHIERCVPGQSTLGVLPGDFVLTRGHGWTSWLIRVGERLRYRGKDRKYAYWNHTALFVSTNGDIIEALGSGVTKRNISLYKPIDYHVVHLDGVSNDVRQNEVVFAEHCLQLNQKYGYLTIVSIALSLLFGGRFGFGIGQEICSGLVARALERTGEIFPQEPWHMMPADLAKAYQMDPPVSASKTP